MVSLLLWEAAHLRRDGGTCWGLLPMELRRLSNWARNPISRICLRKVASKKLWLSER